jgi:hypothetical protein
MGSGRVALALAGCALLAGAVGMASGTARSADPPVANEVRACGTRGEGRKPQRLPVPVGARIGQVVIWPSIRSRVEAAPRGPWRYYVKAPVVVRARAKVVLAVPDEAAQLVGLQSRRHTLRGVRAIRFEACREGHPAFAYRGTVGRYTGFPFGFWLARRSACIPLEAWVEGRAAPIRRLVPFGRRSCA